MYPAFPVPPPPPPPPPPHYVQRSRSDDHVPVNDYSINSIRPGPRSSSFSASRARPPQWDSNSSPPPPPVPPLPRGLVPGFYGPPTTHANIDFTFTAQPRHPLVPHPWQPAAPSSAPHDLIAPLLRPVSESAPPQWNTQSSNLAPPPPLVPPRPTTSSGYATIIPNTEDRDPSSYAHAQGIDNLDRFLPPPPVVPPRPVFVHGEPRIERSHTMSLQAPQPLLAVPVSKSLPAMSLRPSPPPPPVPPKINFTSPVTSIVPSAGREHIPTTSLQGSTVSTSSDAQLIPNTSVIRPRSPLPDPPPPKLPLPEPPATEPTSRDSELKRAVTQSLQEPQRIQSDVKASGNEEDDELARALPKSLSLSVSIKRSAVHNQKHLQSDDSHLNMERDNHDENLNEVSESPLRTRPFLGDILSPEELEDHAAHGQIMQELEDKEVTRRMQEEEEKQLEAEMRKREREAEERTRMDEELMKRLQEEDVMRMEAEKLEREQKDEEIARKEEAEERAREMIREAQERKDAEMARRMAESDEDGLGAAPKEHGKAKEIIREAQARIDADIARRIAETNGAGPGRAPAPNAAFVSNTPPGPPQYNDSLTASGPRRLTRPVPHTAQSAPPTQTQMQPPMYSGSPPPTRPGRTASASAGGPVRPQAARLGDRERSATMSLRRGVDVNGNNGNGQRGDDGSRSQSGGVAPPSRSGSPAPGSSNGASRRSNASPARAGPSAGASQGPVVPSQSDNTAETDLLRGVSYGFALPDLRSIPPQPEILLPCPPFPEVISINRAPSIPFHIRATSWRHLMRLLAQLETRIQANLDAIADSKEEYRLRCVVQIVKLPNSANAWCTMLHLTLDEPIPRNTPNLSRYSSKDTTTLPYSYTLNPPGTLMPTSGPTSHLYTIPLSSSSPFPILPITLPNLALYLQSAMRDSRTAATGRSDPVNGMRRLAKVVSECYPEETCSADGEGRPKARTGMSGFIKKVVGRTERQPSVGNEDVYDIITPFRIDQYAVS